MGMMAAKKSLLQDLDQVQALLAVRPFGLFVDLDGTISPIVVDPMSARATESAVRSLAAIRRKGASVAVVSGRAARLARAMVGLRGITYVGSHGLETYERGRLRRERGLRGARRQIATLTDRLTPILAPLGITIESKGASVAFHVRGARDQAVARRALDEALWQAPEARELGRIAGRQVVELRAPTGATKGTAVQRIALRHRLRSLIYVGDDETDVDAFDAVHQLRREHQIAGLSAAVVGSETAPLVAAAADYMLEGVPEVERFLAWLAGVL